jgi:hypothetical protein
MDPEVEEERGPDGGSRAWRWRLGRRGAVPGHFDVEEERGANVEAHMEGTRRRQKRRSGRWRVCDGEMTGLGFRGSGTLKKKNGSDGHDDVINARRYYGSARCYYAYARHYRLLKNRV